MSGSLYGGISFKDQQAAAEIARLEEEAAAARPATASTPSSAVPSAPLAPTEDKDAKAKSAWSASLRFAPVTRKVVKKAPAAIPSAFKSAFASAEDASPVSQGPRIVGRAKPSPFAAATSTAPPALYPASPAASTSYTPTPVVAAPPLRSGRTLKPPPMTLDEEDVNGFRQTATGKRAAGRKGRGGKKGGKREDPALAFTDVPYEPARPCDYSAYKAHLSAGRTRRRLEREEELRRARSPSGSSCDGSSDGERSGEEDHVNKKARFAPPTSYDSPAVSSEPFILPPPTFAPSVPNPVAPPVNETGEEAYLRRVAMSSMPKPPQPQFVASSPYPASPVPHFSPASTVTTQHAGPSSYPPPPPSFVSSSSSSYAPPTAYVPPAAYASSPAPTVAYNPPPPPSFIPPPFGPPASYDDFPPFRPPPPLPADLSAGGPPPVGGVPFSEAAARARDIAQRLGKLAGLQPPPPPPAPVVNDEPDNRPFAERMMSKFGWKEGRGLGADESGMTAALTVSKPSGPPKKGKEKNAKDAPPVSAPTGMAVGAKGRGSIVDASREGRVASQTKELGEPSRVVLLTNLCGRDDVDDDLGGEVAEEANKFGVVDRCFVYLVPGEERDDETVRIFLVMSGLAGGYNAVRQFEGRFFGGRVVKARFYDEGRFNAGEHRL